MQRIKNLNNRLYAKQAIAYLPTASYDGARHIYYDLLNDPNIDNQVLAAVGLNDRFFLLVHVLMRGDLLRQWLYERCREVEANPDGYLDLWAREHYKSTIITFAGSIQEIARDAEITIGIFSHTRPIAKAFVNQIKMEAENNENLKSLYPESFWPAPKSNAPIWSLDNGLVFRRKTNPKEATVEGWGLVDGQPTSKHYKLRIYDDVVTKSSVHTPEMIIKTTDSWELSQHLASTDFGSEDLAREWYIGTRYNFADTYAVMITREAVKPRLYPATDNGTPDGKPVLLSPTQWAKKKRDSSIATIACQMLQNPLAGQQQELKPEWMRRYELRPETLNIAILGDPASSKKKGSSNSGFAVIGIDYAWNKYLLDGACHKMSLAERWIMLKYLRFRWLRARGIQIVKVGYEKYGMQADIEHFQQMMKIQKCAFHIEPVSWPKDREIGAKDDRIRRLIPDHQNWKFFYPYDGDGETALQIKALETNRAHLVARPIKRKDENGKVYDLVERLIANEYLFFPATTQKDMLDAMSRFYDLDMNPPQKVDEKDLYPEHSHDF